MHCAPKCEAESVSARLRVRVSLSSTFPRGSCVTRGGPTDNTLCFSFSLGCVTRTCRAYKTRPNEQEKLGSGLTNRVWTTSSAFHRRTYQASVR